MDMLCAKYLTILPSFHKNGGSGGRHVFFNDGSICCAKLAKTEVAFIV
jgi:hypothetical protein